MIAVYILSNKPNGTLYVGATSNLSRRIMQHKNKASKKSFSAQYSVNKLMYFECFEALDEAFAREKQLKAGSRMKKILLINKFNPQWVDLYDTLPRKYGP
ncbi:MAG: GIY-YIG nuclease family protein [Bacteroidia bacterium]